METNEKTAPITVEKDRNTISLDLMNRMKLHGMAAAFTESLSLPGMGLPFRSRHPATHTHGIVPIQSLFGGNRLYHQPRT